MAFELPPLVSGGAVFNNAAQTWNHTFYFNCLSPAGGGVPGGALLEAIDAKWGTFENFKKAFSANSIGLFGSGWGWLVVDDSGCLETCGNTPITLTPATTAPNTWMLSGTWSTGPLLSSNTLKPPARNKPLENRFWHVPGHTTESRHHAGFLFIGRVPPMKAISLCYLAQSLIQSRV